MRQINLKVNSKLKPLIEKHKPIKVIVGGRGCVHPDTLIETPNGKIKIKDFQGGYIYAYDNGKKVIAKADKPYQGTVEQLYEIGLSDGHKIITTDKHKVLTQKGWACVDMLSSGCALLKPSAEVSPFPFPTSLGICLSKLRSSVQHYSQKLLDYLDGCSLYHRLYGQRLLQVLNSGLTSPQPQACGQQHSYHASCRLDGQELADTNSPSLTFDRVSSLAFLQGVVGKNFVNQESYNDGKFFEQPLELHLSFQRFLWCNILLMLTYIPLKFFQVCGFLKRQAKNLQIVFGKRVFSFLDIPYFSPIKENNITHITYIRKHSRQRYWDLHVPHYNNYIANGVINHNSGKSIGISDILTGVKMFAEGHNILCLREFQQSIEESVHNVMAESVRDRLGMTDWQELKNRLIAPNGAYTHYVGAARNPEALRSLHGFKIAWWEEAQTASEKSLNTLLPTILRTTGAECWFVANPLSSGDPFSQKFLVPHQDELDRNGYYEDDMMMIIVVNWRDNPWWNESSEQLRLKDRAEMSRAKYDHIWEGKYNDEVDDSIIMPEWFDAAIDAHLKIPALLPQNGIKIAAHDPFDDGGDAGGFAIRHGSVITCVDQKRTGLIDVVCDWALDKTIQEQCDWFVWDGDGMGTGLRKQVSDGLAGKNIQTHMFKGSLAGSGQDNASKMYMPTDNRESSKNKTYADTFKNNRAQYYWELAQRFFNTYKAIERGEYIDPADMISLCNKGIGDNMTALRSELCRIPSKPNGQGLIQIMSKHEMKKQGISSPNMADAVMMTMIKPQTAAQTVKINFEGW